MKKKILISLVACFIAAGSFLHFNLAQNNQTSDISLADISVMAQADGESNIPDPCDPGIWTVTYSGGFPSGITVSCSTGGSYDCPLCV